MTSPGLAKNALTVGAHGATYAISGNNNKTGNYTTSGTYSVAWFSGKRGVLLSDGSSTLATALLT